MPDVAKNFDGCFGLQKEIILPENDILYAKPFWWFSRDITKTQTRKLFFLPRVYFHCV